MKLWNTTDVQQHLIQLHEESRYYRRFHHTIVTVMMAGYLGLIFLQANLFNSIVNLSSDNSISLNNFVNPIWIYIIAALLLGVIPCLLIYLFVNYHIAQGLISEQIHIIQEKLGYPEDALLKKKYSGFKDKLFFQQLTTGRGHIIFIFLLACIIAVNIILFFNISHIIGS